MGLAALVVGLIAGFLARKLIAEVKIDSAETEAKRISEKASDEAERAKKTAVLEAKDQIK